MAMSATNQPPFQADQVATQPATTEQGILDYTKILKPHSLNNSTSLLKRNVQANPNLPRNPFKQNHVRMDIENKETGAIRMEKKGRKIYGRMICPKIMGTSIRRRLKDIIRISAKHEGITTNWIIS
ncbi:hypothetical protein HAX54_039107 [Datura stramonium]|uniref:Uncharacterized protein n=1 Tax=Datura stramonium TaxID=4076 RepID=A0ABS8SJR7_DATST|nr:hypothetical protein [Datura stramonium]